MIKIFNIFNLILPGNYFFEFRRFLLKAAGVKIERGVRVNVHTQFYFNNVQIGAGSWVGPAVSFFSTPAARISIGKNCDIAPGVMFVCGSHKLGSSSRRAGEEISDSIAVGDGCWIGTGAVLLGGASLGAGCVVGASALLRKGEYPPDSLIVGAPARVRKKLDREGGLE